MLLTLSIGGLFVLSRSPGISAQDASPTAMSGHPLVGAWVLDTDTSDAANPPTLASFSADGVYTQNELDNGPGIGSWHATGARTAELTFHSFGTDEQGNYGGMVTVRADIEVAADGQSLTATYTLELVDANGSGTGQYGPGNVSGTRIAVEPMGTPEGPLSALFGEAQGTPEATPAT